MPPITEDPHGGILAQDIKVYCAEHSMRQLSSTFLGTLLLFAIVPLSERAVAQEETAAEIEARCRASAGIEDLKTTKGTPLFQYRRCITNAKQKEKSKEKGERKKVKRETLQQKGNESFEESGRGTGDALRRSHASRRVRPLTDRAAVQQKLREGRSKRRLELQDAEAEDFQIFEEENTKEVRREQKSCEEYPKREQRRCVQRERTEREKHKEEWFGKEKSSTPADLLRASRRACAGLRGEEKLTCLRNALRGEDGTK